VEDCLLQLEKEGFLVEPSPIIPEAIKCLRGNLATSNTFKEGLLTIQDESSMLAAYALGVKKDDRILDACAAPGGKSTHIAEKLQNSGKVLSLDLHEHKVKLIAENAGRLGLTNIETKKLDSRTIQGHIEAETFDSILLDAPCSGLGVMRRKPDMKYTKREEDLSRLQQIQLDLLEAVSPLVKKGGTIVYSTCTVDREENQETVRLFLEKNPGFEGDLSLADRMPEAVRPLIRGYDIQILPQDLGSDGFYIACLQRKVD
jgi:16S rRNA (cytosine967-C5)-methyltransferase